MAKVDPKDARAAAAKLQRVNAYEALEQVREKLGMELDTFLEKLGAGVTEYENWAQGIGRPQMAHVNNIQRDVLDFNNALSSAQAAKEGIDLSKLRGLISDLDRDAGTSPYRDSNFRGRG